MSEAAVRILVLTSSTGAGHDTRAYAFERWAKRLYPESCDVRVEHALERASLTGRVGVAIYNRIQRHGPWLHKVYWQVAEVFSWAQTGELKVGKKHYERVLREYRPHLVLSVHDCLNRGYFETARRVLGEVRCATYCGEWSGGYGFSRNWVSGAADRFVGRTEATVERAVAMGLARERCGVFTNFLRPEFLEEATVADAAQAREALGLEAGKFTVFLAAGGVGANRHRRLLDALEPLAEQVQAIAVCGSNARAYREVEAWRLQPGRRLRVHLDGNSRRIREYLQVSDVVVTRGGANTAAEALYCGCVPVFFSFAGIMPQERLTLAPFVGAGAAVAVGSVRGVVDQVRAWSGQPGAFVRAREALGSLRRRDHPEAFVGEMVALAREAARNRKRDPAAA